MKLVTKGLVLAVAAVALSSCSTFKGLGGAKAPIVNGDEQNQSQTHAIDGQASFDSEGVGSTQATGLNGIPTVIHFGFDKFSLNPSEQAVAQKSAEYLLQNPSSHVMITGNTDPRGSQEYNFHLGQRRAEAVKHYLLAQGVPESQMCTVSYGELRPAATPAQFGGNWHKAYAMDRRSEIVYGQTCRGQKPNA